MIWILSTASVLLMIVISLIITAIRVKRIKKSYENYSNTNDTFDSSANEYDEYDDEDYPHDCCAVCDYAEYYYSDPVYCKKYGKEFDSRSVCKSFSSERFDYLIKGLLP